MSDNGNPVPNESIESAPRSRMVEWTDPLEVAAQGRQMGGLEFIRALIDGRVPPPPIVHLMRFTAVSADVGTVTFTCEPDESMYNPLGTVHGGLVCALLDTVLGCATQTTLGVGQGYTSLEIKVNYLKPVLASSGTLTATGTVTKPGRRAAFAEGTVVDASGKLVATASSTLLVFEH